MVDNLTDSPLCLDVPALISDIVSLQFDIFKEMEQRSTAYVYKAAQYSKMAKQLEAQRELVQLVFNKNLAEQQRLYDSASKVLDKAIEIGEVELAGIATTVIKVAHSKQII